MSQIIDQLLENNESNFEVSIEEAHYECFNNHSAGFDQEAEFYEHFESMSVITAHDVLVWLGY